METAADNRKWRVRGGCFLASQPGRFLDVRSPWMLKAAAFDEMWVYRQMVKSPFWKFWIEPQNQTLEERLKNVPGDFRDVMIDDTTVATV